MARVQLRRTSGWVPGRGAVDRWVFECPGCRELHGVHDGWEFNGDRDRPTFSPSILVAGSDPERRCHSFVRNGKIEFLSDCHHELAGKTVELPEVEG